MSAPRSEPYHILRGREDSLLRAAGWEPGVEDTLSTGVAPLVRRAHPDPLRSYWSERAAVLARLLKS